MSAEAAGDSLRNVLMKQGRYSEAETLIRSNLEQTPGSLELREMLADVLIVQGKVPEAGVILKAGFGDLRLRLKLALAMIDNGMLKQAGSILKEMESASPENQEIGMARADLLFRQGKTRESLKACRALCAAGPRQLKPYFQLAGYLARLGEETELRGVLRQAQKMCPLPSRADAEGCLERFYLAIWARDYMEAESLGEIILDERPEQFHQANFGEPSGFSSSHCQIGGVDEILAELNRYLRSNPKSRWGYYFRAYYLSASDHAPLMFSDCRRIRRFPRDRYGWMLYFTGRRWLSDWNFKEALEDLTAAVESSRRSNWRAQCYIAEAHLCRGDLPKSLAALKEARKFVPSIDHGHIDAWEGEILLWAGKYEKSLEAFDAAIKQGPVRYAYGWKGGALVMLGRYDEAIKILDRGISLLPWDTEARIWRCEALYRLNRLKEAASGVVESEDFYFSVIAGLIQRALGNSDAMRREFHRIPSQVVDYVRLKKGIPGDKDSEIHQILEGIIALSRGVRRGNHELAAWMR